MLAHIRTHKNNSFFIPLLQFLSGLTTTRKRSGVDFSSVNQVELFVDDQLLVFTRGSNMQVQV